jgi:FkbM family methyltransferase
MILCGPARQQKFLVTETSGFEPIICRRERFVFETIGTWMKSSKIAYDIGANEGLISCFMARRAPLAKVFSFDPLIENLQTLERNARMNRVENRIFPIPLAVSDKTGFSTFHRGSNLCEGHLEESNFGQADDSPIEIPTVSLDDFVYQLGKEAPHLVKIDVEGAAGLVLKGASNLMRQVRPYLVIEFHSFVEIGEVWKILVKQGYLSCTSQRRLWDGKTWSTHIAAWPDENKPAHPLRKL